MRATALSAIAYLSAALFALSPVGYLSAALFALPPVGYLSAFAVPWKGERKQLVFEESTVLQRSDDCCLFLTSLKRRFFGLL